MYIHVEHILYIFHLFNYLIKAAVFDDNNNNKDNKKVIFP